MDIDSEIHIFKNRNFVHVLFSVHDGEYIRSKVNVWVGSELENRITSSNFSV